MVVLTVLASGCMGGGSSPEDSPSNFSEGSGEPSISVLSVSAPEKVALGDQVTFDVTVSNSGNAEGDFYSSVRASRKKFGYEEPEATGKELSDSIGAEEESTLSWEFQASTVGTFNFSLSSHQGFSIVRIGPRNLSIGETYNNSRGISMTVENVEFRESYQIRNDSGSPEEKNIEAGKIAFVNYRTENIGSSAELPTSGHNIYLWTSGSRYEDTTHVEEAVNYRGHEVNRLQPGETSTGYLSYRIPSGAEKSNLKITWNEEIGRAQKKVNWKP